MYLKKCLLTVINGNFCVPSRVIPVYLDLKLTSQVYEADEVAVRFPRPCKLPASSSKVPPAPSSGQGEAVGGPALSRAGGQ